MTLRSCDICNVASILVAQIVPRDDLEAVDIDEEDCVGIPRQKGYVFNRNELVEIEIILRA